MNSAVKRMTRPGAWLGLCLGVMFAHNGHSAPNFNYSQLHLQFGQAQFDEVIELNQTRYKSLLVWGASVSYQQKNHLVWGINHTQGTNQSRMTKLESQATALTLGYPFALAYGMDLYGNIGYYKSQAKACIETLCYQQNDQAPGYDLGFRAQLGTIFEYGLNYKIVKYPDFGDNESIAGYLAVWLDRRSRLSLNGLKPQDNWAATIGYKLSF